jgi:cation diffusion facilitator family transporter
MTLLLILGALKIAPRLALFGACINAALAVIKGVAGYFGESHALVADAIESGTDVLSSTLVYFGLRYAARPADKNHPYGHGRAEPLVTIAVVIFLAVAAVTIAIRSVQHILAPHGLPKPYTLVVLGGVILIKEVLYRVISRKGRELHSTAVLAEAWHHRSDAITSLAAFAGIAFALFMGKGFETSDEWASLFVSGVILYNGYRLFRPALAEMMDEHIYEDLVDLVREVSIEVEGVRGTEKCLVRKSGNRYHVDLHMRVDPDLNVRTAHDISHRLKTHLLMRIPQLADVLIHIEPA